MLSSLIRTQWEPVGTVLVYFSNNKMGYNCLSVGIRFNETLFKLQKEAERGKTAMFSSILSYAITMTTSPIECHFLLSVNEFVVS